MPVWVALQVALDIVLVGVILWLSWRPSSAMVAQRTQLTELLEDAEIKMAELQALLQRAEEILQTPLPATPPLAESLYEEAATLALQGCTLEEIASRVKLPRGEIELIMHLKRTER